MSHPDSDPGLIRRHPWSFGIAAALGLTAGSTLLLRNTIDQDTASGGNYSEECGVYFNEVVLPAHTTANKFARMADPNGVFSIEVDLEKIGCVNRGLPLGNLGSQQDVHANMPDLKG